MRLRDGRHPEAMAGDTGQMNLACYEHDRGFILSQLNEGRFDYIDAASEIEECEFFRFIGARRKYIDALATSYPSPRRKEEVPTWFYVSSNLSMRLHGVQSYNSYPLVVRCGGMLNAFGPGVAHKAEHPDGKHVTLSCAGFNNKNDYDRQTPCDQDFLRKLSKDTDPAQLEKWFNTDVAVIYRQHKVYDKAGIFIGDASYIFVPDNENYEGSVRLLFGPDNHPVDSKQLAEMPPEKAALCEWKRCYKLVSLIHTDQARSFSLRVALRVVGGNEHECPVFYDLLDQFVRAVGPEVVKRLILDRGFIDGEKISHAKRGLGIDVLIPLKKNMQLYADVLGLLNLQDVEFQEFIPTKRTPVNEPRMREPSNVPEKIRKREAKRQETLRAKKQEQAKNDPPPLPDETLVKTESAAIFGFNSWDTCTVPINLIVNRDTFADGHQTYWILLDTKPLDSKRAALERRQEYSIRTEIEEGHRQLKCFWDLTKFTSRAFSLVLNQIVFVVLAFNLLQVWLRTTRKNHPTDPRKSRSRLLDQLLPTQTVIIVYCQNRFATFSPLEYTDLMLGLPEQARGKILEKVRRLRRALSCELRQARPA